MKPQAAFVVTYRITREEDYSELIELWKKTPGVGLSSADSPDNFKRYLKRNPGYSFTAESNGSILGAILAGHDGRRGYLYHLAVLPKWQRKGIGSTLVNKALDALKKSGIEKCHIFVFNANIDGCAFWHALGWETRKDISIMSKLLY